MFATMITVLFHNKKFQSKSRGHIIFTNGRVEGRVVATKLCAVQWFLGKSMPGHKYVTQTYIHRLSIHFKRCINWCDYGRAPCFIAAVYPKHTELLPVSWQIYSCDTQLTPIFLLVLHSKPGSDCVYRSFGYKHRAGHTYIQTQCTIYALSLWIYESKVQTNEICRTCIMQQEHTLAGYKVRLVINLLPANVENMVSSE